MTDNPLLKEYELCQHTIEHLDTQNWSWGSFLFGGSLAATGFVLSSHIGFAQLGTVALLSSIVLGGWGLFVNRSIGIRDVCRERMLEIETKNKMGLKTQHYLQTLRQKGSVIIGKRMIHLFRIRSKTILGIMLCSYLAILWIGTLIVWALSEGLLSLP